VNSYIRQKLNSHIQIMATIPTYPSKNTLTGDELIVISDTANDTRTRHATINSILTLMPGIPCCSLQGGYNSGGDVITSPGKEFFVDTSGGDQFRVTGTMTKDGAGPLSLLGDSTVNSNIDGVDIGQTIERPITSSVFRATGVGTFESDLNVLADTILGNNLSVAGVTTMANLDAADTSFQGTMTVGGLAVSDATFHDDLTVLATGVFTTSDAVITNALIDSSDIGTITPGLVFGTNIANTSGGDVRPDDGKGLSVGAVGGIGSVEAVKSADNVFAHMDFSGTNPAVAPTTVYFHGQEQFMFTDSSNTGIGIAGGLVTYSGLGNDIADINAAGPKVAITKKWIEGPYLGNRTVDLGGFNGVYSNVNALGINDATPGVDGELFSVVGKVKITDGSESPGFFLQCDANGVGTWTSVGAGALNLYTVNGNISDPVRLVGVGSNQLSFNLDPAGLVEIGGGTFKIDNSTTFNFEPGVISAGNIITSDAFGNGTWQTPSNFYQSDGTLAGNRIVTGGGNSLTFINQSKFTIAQNNNPGDEGFLVDVNGTLGAGTVVGQKILSDCDVTNLDSVYSVGNTYGAIIAGGYPKDLLRDSIGIKTNSVINIGGAGDSIAVEATAAHAGSGDAIGISVLSSSTGLGSAYIGKFQDGSEGLNKVLTCIDAFGTTTWQAPAAPTSGTIYTSDGIITDPLRIIDLDSNPLRFDNVTGGIGVGGDNVAGAQFSCRAALGFLLPPLLDAEIIALLPSVATEGIVVWADERAETKVCTKPGTMGLLSQPFLSQGVNAATTPYAVPQTINFVYCDTSAVNIDVNLASATTRTLGAIIKVKDGQGSVAGTYNASVNNIVITPDGLETIDGVNAAQTIAVDGGYIELICDGSSNWWIGTSRLT